MRSRRLPLECSSLPAGLDTVSLTLDPPRPDRGCRCRMLTPTLGGLVGNHVDVRGELRGLAALEGEVNRLVLAVGADQADQH